MKTLKWLTHPAFVAVAMVCTCSLLRAAALEATMPLDTLKSSAVHAIESLARSQGRKVQVAPGELDPRLRLAACNQPVESTIAGDGEIHEYTTVQVRCGGAVRWTIYLRAAVTAEIEVLVARGALQRGAELSLNDFDTVRRTVPGSGADYISDHSGLKGMRLRLPVAAGEALSRGKLEAALMIHRGQKVTLLARSGGIEIRVAGIAMADGRPAERIKVENENSRQVVEAVVRDATLVEVPL